MRQTELSGVPSSVGLEEWAARLGAAPVDVLSLYLRLLPADFLVQLREQAKLRAQNNRIYTDAVVIWLMILQRLTVNGTLETAVLELLRSLPSEFWPQPCKRLQARPEDANTKLSSNTGSYNQARQELPLTIVEQCGDRAFLQLIQQHRPARASRDAFFMDGSSMRMPHNPELCALYPPGSNQKGKSHWPLLRIVVAHDLYSGLAMRPQWGPMYGADAISEQVLLEQAIDRLPKGCVVLGDANFGVFSVAYAATQSGHPVVLRLTMARARCLAKRANEELRDGMDLRMRWKPSPHERRKHRELPAETGVDGRLIVRQVQPSNGEAPFLLALFTTLEDEAGSVIELYGHRWNIETDLRSLKAMLGLEQLRSTTPEMVAKEIDVAMVAYNLVRAVSCLAAQKAGLQPRQFSFTRVRNVIHAFVPLIATASDERQKQQLFDNMMYYVNQARLPQRRKKRPTYLRAVWLKTQKFPKRKP